MSQDIIAAIITLASIRYSQYLFQVVHFVAKSNPLLQEVRERK